MADSPNNTASPAVDAASPVPVPAAPVVAASDPKLEAFARKERQLHKMRKELEAERQQLKTKAAEYETGYISKSKLTEDPFGVLTDAGLSYEQLTERLLNQPNMNDPAMKAIMGKLKAMEDKQSAVEKQIQDREARQYDDAKKAISNEVKQLVASEVEYETIREAKCEEQVLQYIIDTYEKDGVLIDVSEACKHIENYLVEEGYKFSQLNKIKARLMPKTEEPVSLPKVVPPQSQSPMKTLTNAVNSQSSTRPTEKERIARALAAFKGELK